MDTARLVRELRERAGLTQAELADRAGTSGPTVSAYEHGNRQPRTDVLWRLVDAAQLRLEVTDAATLSGRYVDLMCEQLAEHIRAKPEVTDEARAELERMPETTNTRAWRILLDAGPAAIIGVLTSRHPDVHGMKSDNPFARLGLVDEPTRLALLDRARDDAR